MISPRIFGAREDVARVLAAVPDDAPAEAREAAIRLRAYMNQREGEPFMVSLVREMGGRVTVPDVLRVGQYKSQNSARALLSQAARTGRIKNVALLTYEVSDAAR